MSDRQERNFLEAFLEGGEAAIDLMTENEAVKAVPVVGTAIKLLKGFDDMRSRALAAKLTKFLRNLHFNQRRCAPSSEWAFLILVKMLARSGNLYFSS